MTDQYHNEPMLELFIFESMQLIEQMEQLIIANEKFESYDSDAINEIFRIMHTIKGSSAMMLFNNISTLAHSMEDVFFVLREDKPQNIDSSQLSDLVLEGIDFIKVEIAKIRNGDEAEGDAAALIESLRIFHATIKAQNYTVSDQEIKDTATSQGNSAPKKQQYYISKVRTEPQSYSNSFQATLYFEEDCGMENLRAFGVVNDLGDLVKEYYHIPEDLDHEDSAEVIQEQGFTLFFKTDRSLEEIHRTLSQTIYLKDLQLTQVKNSEPFDDLHEERKILLNDSAKIPASSSREGITNDQKESYSSASQQSIISVSVAKLDQLMDLVGEMVIAEAMVTQNPDLKGLELNNFEKAARQLRKITSELQDTVMSVRMVPLTGTFQKMNRTVRDMCKKLNKDVRLELIGQETEVDKNIIEHISDPLMHLIRNSIDHGIEMPSDREMKGKPRWGTIILEAKNAGGDVLIIIRDDGGGFNKAKIMSKAREKGLLQVPEDEITDKEIYNLVFLPGFSTNETVTEFSGRGVGMDVVVKNIEAVGGAITADSVPGKGTTLTLKIPLTLAIIDGMNIKVGDSRYTIPTTAIKESFRPKTTDIIVDPDDNEMIMVRGQCFPILRLHRRYHVNTLVTNFADGIIIMVEQDDQTLCIFADELIGQQQVVVKSLPAYIKHTKKVTGLAGCTLLGDGSISLILDIAGLFTVKKTG
ncbi:chemotaxis protein CheA [Desulfosporosinus lacus]|uniref:Chemotaxis protein CheA n=1 Tax=Desulfosporosinus lacus DSM 15449 TaxID=1121420 RepID=A0A1M6G774_9FIRM|nr:chemotaxis protein CheA [Desulfosporosinus lacus]SHJ05764.1 two-component system, chemotaxis family, sensor kinase CheA [Desulfosporosinus lacus DSM 15449]